MVSSWCLCLPRKKRVSAGHILGQEWQTAAGPKISYLKFMLREVVWSDRGWKMRKVTQVPHISRPILWAVGRPVEKSVVQRWPSSTWVVHSSPMVMMIMIMMMMMVIKIMMMMVITKSKFLLSWTTLAKAVEGAFPTSENAFAQSCSKTTYTNHTVIKKSRIGAQWWNLCESQPLRHYISGLLCKPSPPLHRNPKN